MSVKVPTNRFIVSSLQAGFYQQLFKSISGFQELGYKLVLEAETAHAFRQGPRVEEIISILCNLPIKEYRLIGQYYKGLRAERIGETRSIFEKVAEESRTYKAESLMSLAEPKPERVTTMRSLDILQKLVKLRIILPDCGSYREA